MSFFMMLINPGRCSKQSQFIASWENTVADLAKMVFLDKLLLVLQIIFDGYWQRIAVLVAVVIIFYAMESIVEHLLLSTFCGFACPDPMKRQKKRSNGQLIVAFLFRLGADLSILKHRATLFSLLSHLYNVNPYAGKTVSWYWIIQQIIYPFIHPYPT